MYYDDNNIFAKIIRGDLSSKKVYEDDSVLAFHDVNPVAPVHILVVPKGKYMNYNHFITKASSDEISNFFIKVNEIAKSNGLKDFRLVTNCGKESGQTVFHFHIHIIGGNSLGAMC